MTEFTFIDPAGNRVRIEAPDLATAIEAIGNAWPGRIFKLEA